MLQFPDRGHGGLIADPRIEGRQTIGSIVSDLFSKTKSDGLLDMAMEIDGRLNKERIVKEVKKLYNVGSLSIIEYAMKEKDDKLWKIIYPPRQKSDLLYRRTRFNDVVKYMDGRVQDIMDRMIGHDYIFSLNKLLAYILVTTEEQDMLKPVFCLTIENFDRYTTKLNDKLKSTQMETGWQRVAEMRNLTGHRLEPWPGVDVYKMTEELATGGVQKHIPGGFINSMRTFLSPGIIGEPKIESFSEFVKSGKWITNGASSLGKMEVELVHEGFKTIKIKCKKNMLPDVVDMNDLIDNCLRTTTQVATAFIKPETGKLRVAVCSDIYTYLKMAYIISTTGYGYKNWTKIARNYSNSERISMIKRIVKKCREGYYGMAWDYKGFEKQNETRDVIEPLRIMIEKMEVIMPEKLLGEWKFIGDNVIKSFEQSTIIPNDKLKKPIIVTGGLPSGLLVTSICGDGYNKTMTEQAIDTIDKLGVNPVILDECELTGDDSSYMSLSIRYLQLLDYILKAQGAEAAEGKFGILKATTEFLRVSYDELGAHGYLMRAIPSIVQRKPWNDEPITQTSTIASTMAAIDTALRRGAKDIGLKEQMLGRWCRKNKVSIRSARVPIVSGGLGLGNPITNIKLVKMEPKFEPPLKPTIKTNWRHMKWEEEAKKYEIPITSEQLNLLVEEEVVGIVSSDAIASIGKYVKDGWRKNFAELAQAKIVVSPKLASYPDYSKLQTVLDTYELNANVDNDTSYGVYAAKKGTIATIRKLCKYANIESDNLIRERMPEFDHAVSSLKHLNKNDAENWILGELPVYTSYLNTTITNTLANMTAKLIRIHDCPKGRLTDIWVDMNRRILEKVLPAAQTHDCFMW